MSVPSLVFRGGSSSSAVPARSDDADPPAAAADPGQAHEPCDGARDSEKTSEPRRAPLSLALTRRKPTPP